MHCPECGTVIPDGAKSCLDCGAQLVVNCGRCGAVLPRRAKHCLECGARFVALVAEAAPEREPALVALVRRLVPQELTDRLLATGGQVTPERRVVTILFSDVKGSTATAEGLDPEDVMEVMGGAFEHLIPPIYRHEGTVARLTGDSILAFFGAPIAHEDDPERAIRAALEIIAGAHGYAERLEQERAITGFNVRVGINTGFRSVLASTSGPTGS